jgi:hypothetical protein
MQGRWEPYSQEPQFALKQRKTARLAAVLLAAVLPLA